MGRRFVPAAIAAVILAVPGTVLAESGTQAPGKETGSPINDQGSNYHYRSSITGLTPSAKGVELQVLQFADRMELVNHSGKTVTIYGYEGEPYAQVLADGTVRFNVHSPAYFLNQAFYANVTVPPTASVHATPQWVVVARTGRVEWHDHRIHWMSPVVPPEVKDQGKQTKIFNWQVPIAVGSQKTMINGELFWVPESGTSTPIAAIIALAAIVVLGALFVLTVRRRRARARGGPPGSGAGEEEQERDRPAREAW